MFSETKYLVFIVVVCKWLPRVSPQEMVQTAGEEEQEAAAEAAEAFLAEELPEAVFGAPKAGTGMWASCLRLMHPTEVGGSPLMCGLPSDVYWSSQLLSQCVSPVH